MTTTVVLTTMVVNAHGDDFGSRGAHTRFVLSLLERLEWVIEHRAGGNQRALSRASKLGENHIGVILTRLRKDPTRDIERETLSAIAKGGGVSLRWLASGDGSADDNGPLTREDLERVVAAAAERVGTREHTIERDERYPNRAIAIAKQYEHGASAKAIDLLRKVAHSGDDPPVEWWEKKLAKFEEQVRAARDELRANAGGTQRRRPRQKGAT
jgi:hypothetical protein